MLIFSRCTKDESTTIDSAVPFVTQSNLIWADSLLSTMTERQKIGQLFVWETQSRDPQKLLPAVTEMEIGGFLLKDLPLIPYLALSDTLKRISPIPLFFASEAKTLFNNQFTDVKTLPSEAMINATANDSLFNHLNKLAAKQALTLGINLNLSQTIGAQQFDGSRLQSKRTKALAEQRIIHVATQFSAFYPNLSDTSQRLQILQKPVKLLVGQGIGGIALSSQLPSLPKDAETLLNYQDYFKDQFNYQGLLIRKSSNVEMALRHIQSGIDLMILQNNEPAIFIKMVQTALEQGKLSHEVLDQKVRKILMAKKWMANGFDYPTPHQKPATKALQVNLQQETLVKESKIMTIGKIYRHFIDSKWDYFNYQIALEGITVLGNKQSLLPIKDINQQNIRIVTYGDHPYGDFKSQLNQYINFRNRVHSYEEFGTSEALISGESNYLNILLLEDGQAIGTADSAFLANLEQANQRRKLLIVNFGIPAQIKSLDTTYTILQAYELRPEMESIAAQVLVGGLAAKGALPIDLYPNWKFGDASPSSKIRLSFTPSQFVDIRPEKLVGINAIANGAIRSKATPGCQVLVAKDGHVIYNQSFGYHTYKRKRRVQADDLYDIASVTKIAATALVSMKSFENKQFNINDRIKNHLPEYKNAPFKNTRIKDLMTHQSGIQPHLPVIPYLLYRGPKNTACDSFFCKDLSDTYNIQIADNFYFQERLQDSIWQNMNTVKVNSSRKYKYSDVNMVLTQRLLETKMNQSLDQLAKQYFYQPLGLQHISYNPIDKFKKEQIVPTEKDEKWRQQQLDGFVHDEGAALLGGVAGHAGLFANTKDLAVVMQMLLDGGKYGGRRFLDNNTIDLFTSAKHGNHRGLCFDKYHSSNRSGRASEMSRTAFGHTGFTGTCAWADPETGLVYIFLSNRLHPSVRNRKLFSQRIRARIHQVVYGALDSYENTWPDLVST
ncbi:MAG: glycoside hydrolase family 3 N-terminal domain-containing protein [Saprospiraceae bacterium]